MAKKQEWTDTFGVLGYESEKAMLEDLYCNQGMSVTELSNRLGYARNSIRKRLIEHKIKMKPKGGANYKGKLHLLSDAELEDVKTAAVQHNVHISAIHKERKRREWTSSQSVPPAINTSSSENEETTSSSDSSVSMMQDISNITEAELLQEITSSSTTEPMKDS